MIVHVGSILLSYTGGRSEVESAGASVGAVLDDLDRRFPGLRFRVIDEQDRIRPHIKVFVGEQPVVGLETAVGERDEVHILAALSGG